MPSNPTGLSHFAFPALVICLALALAIWARRKALAAPAEARASVWFWSVRFLRNLNLGTVALWWFVTDLVQLKSRAAFLWADYGLDALPSSNVVFLLFFWIPPIAVLIVCQVLFRPVYSQIRGFEWTRADLARQAAYALGVWLVPALCIVGAVQSLADNDDFATFAFGVVIGMSSLFVSAHGLRKQFFLTPYALTTGELRDRAFGLAARLGVKLRQIYLLPPGKTPLANAFARSGNSILLTEALLTRLNKREVDAVIAHELSHLKHDHPRLLGFVLLGGVVAIAAPYFIVPWQPAIRPYFDLLFVTVPLLAFYFVSRRFEYTADATGAKLTGDPGAAITGLVKLHHLNLMPLEWSKWSEKGLTHPSTVRRAQAIGRASAMSEERIAELLATPMQNASSRDQSGFYTWGASAGAAGKIFSTQFKQRIALRTLLLYLLFSVVLPALLLRALDLLVRPPSGFVAFALTAVALCGLALILCNFLPFASNSRLCRRLRAKFTVDGIPVRSPDSLLVGFSPGSAPCIFESNYTWDAGSLVFAADRLCYFGEQTQFALRREQVVSVQVGEGFPGWFGNKFLYITWRGFENEATTTFNLRPLETHSALHLKRALAQLEDRINAWRAGSASSATLPAQFESLHSPQIGAVTSTSAADAWKPSQAFVILLAVFAISGFMASLLNFPVEWISVPSPFPADVPDGRYAGISGWYAMLTSALTLLIFFAPVWFARRPKSSPPPPVPPPPKPLS